MLPYVLAGLALGSIYAIAASSLVVTYVSAGVLNFAFGSMAYFVARFYYWLNSQHNWGTDTAGAFSLLVVAPLMGVVLYALLFRHLRGKPTLIKLVATIGLSVALPPIADITFGTQSITSAPGLASLSDTPFDFLGTPLTTDQIIIYGFLAFVVLLGTVVLRLTDVGLRIRALVDSEAMASLSGTNPGRVAVGVWAFTATLAGLAGILVAPSQGLTTAGMTALMAAAFAAVVVARPALPDRGRRRVARHGRGDRRHSEVPAAQQPLHGRDHPEHPVRFHRGGPGLLPPAGGLARRERRSRRAAGSGGQTGATRKSA